MPTIATIEEVKNAPAKYSRYLVDLVCPDSSVRQHTLEIIEITYSPEEQNEQTETKYTLTNYYGWVVEDFKMIDAAVAMVENS